MSVLNVSAVVILYNPNEDTLKKGLNAIANQVAQIILVDNSPNKLTTEFYNDLPILITDKMHYIFNNENLGIAKSQNLGIIYALKAKRDYVITFDQDSISSDDMVLNLKKDYDLLLSRNIKVAAIGPDPINIQTQKPYKPRIKKQNSFFKDLPEILDVTELISSGSLIAATVFEEVGLLDETLFIDGVDHEWCWRAKTKGYKCAQTRNAKLYHMLGEGDRKILGIRIAITSPFRMFYQYRNFIYLCTKAYVPTYWKINNFIKYAIKLVYYPIFVTPRGPYLKNILRGIKAGLAIRNSTYEK